MARSIGLQGDKKWPKPDWHHPFYYTKNYAPDKHVAISKSMDTTKLRMSTKCDMGSDSEDDVVCTKNLHK